MTTAAPPYDSALDTATSVEREEGGRRGKGRGGEEGQREGGRGEREGRTEGGGGREGEGRETEGRRGERDYNQPSQLPFLPILFLIKCPRDFSSQSCSS